MVYPSPELLSKINVLSSTERDKLFAIKPWIEGYNKKYTTSMLQSPVDDILILCVDFIDKPAQIPILEIYNRYFSTTDPNSFLNYWKEVSYNTYVPSGNVFGWYRAPNPSTYYADNHYGSGTYPNNYQKLYEDVLNIMRTDPSVDLSLFDKDNDNKLNHVVVVHSGPEAAVTGNPNDFWAFSWSIVPRLVNGYGFEYFMTSAEYERNVTDTQKSGIDCHEFGHILGLPDLYNSFSPGVGYFSLMANGSWANAGITPVHLDAWSKHKLGFLDYTENVYGQVSLPNSETNNTSLKYLANSPFPPLIMDEYFIIENRQRLGFDTYIPSEGLLIWHINENMSGNDNPDCYLVRVLQADGNKDIEFNRNSGDLGDTFPGITNNRLFTTYTNPNTELCDGSVYELEIYNISDSGLTMTFNARQPCITPSCSFSLL